MEGPAVFNPFLFSVMQECYVTKLRYRVNKSFKGIDNITASIPPGIKVINQTENEKYPEKGTSYLSSLCAE